MKHYKVFVIWFITIIISAGLFDFLPAVRYGDYAMPIAREKFDTRVYWEGSDWIKRGEHPYYKHEFDLAALNYFKEKGQIPYVSETYPLLGIIYFSLPALFTNNFDVYQALMFCWNALWLLFLMIGLHNIFILLKKHWTYLLFLLLPSFLYFTFNRYDIFPSALVIWSIYYLLTSKYNFSFIILSLGILVKIYPILLLPIYLLYLKERNISWIKYFMLTIGIGLTGLTISILWSGWWPAITPYIMHWLRTETGGSLIYALASTTSNGIFLNFIRPLFKMLTIIIPLALTALLFFKNKFQLTIDTSNFLRLTSLVLIMPAIFGFFYSNQWVIWFVPLLLTIGGWPILINSVIHDVLNYLQFPIIGTISTRFYHLSYNWFIYISLIRSLFLIITLVILIKPFVKKTDHEYFSNE